MILYVFQWLQILVVAPVSVAQDSISISSNIPNCTDDEYNWTYNSMGQSPCYVADVLAMQSIGQTYTIGSLSTPGAAYSFSSSFSNGSCYCNTVWYSLISACAICQNGTWLTWPNYAQNCNQTYLMQFPDPIPSNTSVPGWAYLNVTATNDAFDPTAAHNLAVGSSSTVSASTSASTSTSSSSSSPSSHSSKTNVGAIAGGVIGCVVGGALISALLFWLHTKHKASRPDSGMSPQISERKIMDSPPSTGFSAIPSPPPSTNTSAVPSPPWTDTTAIPSPPLTNSPTPVQQVYQDALQKTHDPDDIPTSSTFPRFRDEAPRGLLPNTEHHWGQVGQYYADIPEL
ncbi:hypothetical protein F5887DRAFT_475615 [Amanita rubescens]|nr:hypothetical protein F5887DRAFT_475615 [Amanita rubescens]